MNKRIMILLVTMLVFILGNAVLVFADAASYDMQVAGYNVYVATPDGGLNMRHGPGSDYGKVMSERIPDDVMLYIGYVSGNWGYTSYNGNAGWVYLPQTTTTPPATQSYTKEPAGFYVYVTTPDGGLNMRQGPGSSYSKVMQNPIPDYVQLYISYTSGDWGYTAYNGNEGWVYLPQTSSQLPSGAGQETEPTEPEKSEPDTSADSETDDTKGDDYVEEELADDGVEDEGDKSEKKKIINSPFTGGELEENNNSELEEREKGEPTSAERKDAENVKKSMGMQLLMAVCILLLIIAISLLVLMFINDKKRK